MTTVFFLIRLNVNPPLWTSSGPRGSNALQSADRTYHRRYLLDGLFFTFPKLVLDCINTTRYKQEESCSSFSHPTISSLQLSGPLVIFHSCKHVYKCQLFQIILLDAKDGYIQLNVLLICSRIEISQEFKIKDIIIKTSEEILKLHLSHIILHCGATVSMFHSNFPDVFQKS